MRLLTIIALCALGITAVQAATIQQYAAGEVDFTANGPQEGMQVISGQRGNWSLGVGLDTHQANPRMFHQANYQWPNIPGATEIAFRYEVDSNNIARFWLGDLAPGAERVQWGDGSGADNGQARLDGDNALQITTEGLASMTINTIDGQVFDHAMGDISSSQPEEFAFFVSEDGAFDDGFSITGSLVIPYNLNGSRDQIWFRWGSATFPNPPVPEPGTIALLALAGGSLAAARRRRNS